MNILRALLAILRILGLKSTINSIILKIQKSKIKKMLLRGCNLAKNKIITSFCKDPTQKQMRTSDQIYRTSQLKSLKKNSIWTCYHASPTLVTPMISLTMKLMSKKTLPVSTTKILHYWVLAHQTSNFLHRKITICRKNLK